MNQITLCALTVGFDSELNRERLIEARLLMIPTVDGFVKVNPWKFGIIDGVSRLLNDISRWFITGFSARPVAFDSGSGGNAMPEDLSRFCCQNAGCDDHGKRGLGNPTACGRYGKMRQHRLLYCRSCKARSSERKGTPLFGSQLTEDKAASLFRHLADRNGVRATARSVGVRPNTVVRYSRLAGGHARELHDEFVAVFPRTREVQFDEEGSFVAKKQAHCDPDDPADDHKGGLRGPYGHRPGGPVGPVRRPRRPRRRGGRGCGRGRQTPDRWACA